MARPQTRCVRNLQTLLFMKNREFLKNMQEIRERARKHLHQGALTSHYQGDVKAAIRILNEALATEIICTLRYTSHYYLAEGIHAESVRKEFREHANEEQEHAWMLAERIRQLGGKPDFHPGHALENSHAEFKEGDTLVELIEEDLVAERIAIETYREMAAHFAEYDPTTRRLIEEILQQEEKHAEEMAGLLSTLSPERKPVNPDRESAA